MQRMRDLLRGSLARSLRELPGEDRLAAAWPVACGPALAVHGEVLHLDEEGVLHVRVTGREWFQQFLDIRSTLAADLARIAGVKLHGIHFEEQGSVRPWPRNPSTPNKESR
jgi:Dna[CI] antecedent, DciA